MASQGTPDNITLSSFSDVNATLVATNLSCSLYYPCTNTTIETNVGCSDNGGYAEVTCAVGKCLENVTNS